jgi:hypothetical protein
MLYPPEMEVAKTALEDAARALEMKGYAAEIGSVPAEDPAWVTPVTVACLELTVTRNGRAHSLSFEVHHEADMAGQVFARVDGKQHPRWRSYASTRHIAEVTAWFVDEYLVD